MKLVIGMLFVLLTGFVAVNMTTGGAAQESSKSAKVQEDATPIEIGVMSEKQKQHSKLYKGYSEEVSIPEKLKKNREAVELYRLAPLTMGMRSTIPASTYELLKKIACEADAVVLGKVTAKASQLTEAQNFVFTDYEFSVQEVMRNVTLNPVSIGGEITVTRPGGSVAVQGRLVRATDESFPLLSEGSQYLLFLRYIAETDSFRSIEGGESFELSGNKVKWLRSYSPGYVDREYTPSSLLNATRRIAQECDSTKGGAR